jgi:hypothetical protein
VSSSVWEIVFMLLILKIPVVYLSVVVWWAVRAEPEHGVGGDELGVLAPLTPCGWDDWRRRRAKRPRTRPFGPTGRRYPATRVHLR